MPSFVYTFLSIALFLFIFSRIAASSTRRSKQTTIDFWAMESKANSTRRADISGLDYLNIPLDTLPMDDLKSAGFEKLASQLEELSTRKIINLSMYTNTELKMMYGPANLPDLSAYDENYIATIRLLNKIGVELTENGHPELAGKFLSYGVSIGSDITNTYTLLGQYYMDSQLTSEFDNLILRASTLTSLSKDAIINKLNNIKSASK